MPNPASPTTQRLHAAAERLSAFSIADALAGSDRAARYAATEGDLRFDYAKARVDDAALSDLIALAGEADIAGWRDKMFAGETINSTEGRAVLHVALRSKGPFSVAGADVSADVEETRNRMLAFADGVRDGSVSASDGGRFTDVVNIGIGGSDLGPRMAARALSPYRGNGPAVHFVANVDGADIADTLAGLNPARTLILIASKTFTTQETMTNAATARAWVADALGETAVGAHFAALSTAADKVADFGIDADRTFGFKDWVGGRYSVWSSIGLSVALAIGADNFRAFLAGGAAADTHFRERPVAQNIPMLMGLIGWLYRSVLGWGAYAVLPYDQRLMEFAAHLQQVDMESNGKRVTRDGTLVDGPTGPVIFGEPGTNGQHAFYQLLHQGTDIIPCDILVAATAHESLSDHHAKLIANALAQSQALMRGRTLKEARDQLIAKGALEAVVDALAPHRVFPGNRPSNLITYTKLTPYTLGLLLAFYE
ncbi:MAG: glucose-6-phosphate isomerase, partial [Pseudomonadota bacterium]